MATESVAKASRTTADQGGATYPLRPVERTRNESVQCREEPVDLVGIAYKVRDEQGRALLAKPAERASAIFAW